MPAVVLEVLSLMPTVYRQCAHCEIVYTQTGQTGLGEKKRTEELLEYPKEIVEEHERLSEWMKELARHYGQRLEIRLIDPQSGVGLWKALRHRVRQYPTFIINHRDKYAGWDKTALKKIIDEALNHAEEGVERA